MALSRMATTHLSGLSWMWSLSWYLCLGADTETRSVWVSSPPPHPSNRSLSRHPPQILVPREAAAPTAGDTFSKTSCSYPQVASWQILFAYCMLYFPSSSSVPPGPVCSPFPPSPVPAPSPPIPVTGCQWPPRFSGQEWAVVLNVSTGCFAPSRFDSLVSTGQHGCRKPYFNCRQLILCATISSCCLRLPVTTAQKQLGKAGGVLFAGLNLATSCQILK